MRELKKLGDQIRTLINITQYKTSFTSKQHKSYLLRFLTMLNEVVSTWFLYFVLFAFSYLFTNHFLHRFQNLPPTPFLRLPIIGHLHLLKKPLYRTLADLAAGRSAPVLFLRFGSRPVLVVSSPSAAEECLSKNDVAFAGRPRLLLTKHLAYDSTTIAWLPYGDFWRNMRRIASIELLSNSRLQMLSGIRKDEVNLLMQRLLNRRRDDETAVEFRTLFFELTLNAMMRMIAGKRYYMEEETDKEESKRFREIQEELLELAGAANLGDFVPWLQSRKLERRMSELGKKRDKFLQDLVDEIRGGSMGDSNVKEERKKTMVEVLLSLQATEPENYTDVVIKSIIVTMLAAGTETTSTTLEWTLSLLLNNPEAFHKARAEIYEVVGFDRLIDDSDLPQLPYLRSIITETLRIYPPVPLLLPHESTKPCTVGGFHIPTGTLLFINAWAIQNDPGVWEDPTKFKPERFQGFEGSKDGINFLPFGSGRRSCPGDMLGLKMIGLTLGSLIQCFDLGRVGKEMVNMEEGSGLTLPRAQPLHATCCGRPEMGDILSKITSTRS